MKVINLTELEDGDLAIIIKESLLRSTIDVEGKLVQRYKNDLIIVGINSDHAWKNLFLTENRMYENPGARKIQLIRKARTT